MNRWQVKDLSRPVGRRAMPPSNVPRTSKALVGSDALSVVGLLLSIAAALGWITPEELETAQGGVEHLAVLAQAAFAAVFALAAFAGQIFRWIRERVEEIRS